MRYYFIFIALLVVSRTCHSQSTPVAKPNVYAVVVGIANYENKNIPNLNYSNRDAEVFADYLSSSAGGSIAKDHIRLLLDTNATTAAIYNSLNWLRDRCETDQADNPGIETTVYFYFSGHGDVENETVKELGFLLSYNTPGNNYLNNALRLEDLNYYANTLSTKYKAKVVIITDACHSGKLAGSDFNGGFLVGRALNTAKTNEIRITACKPEQLSQENEAWGGGRGIFSYYLVNGLKGMADADRDGFVTLGEIQTFLESSIANDAVMKQGKLQQNPVLKGSSGFQLASVKDEMTLFAPAVMGNTAPVQSNDDYFFSRMLIGNNWEQLDYDQLSKLSRNDIAAALIQQEIQSGDSTVDKERLQSLISSLKANNEKLTAFNERLADALHTYGQKVINLYLEGDEAELERRRYYNNPGRGYAVYPAMYSTALKLTDADNPLANILQVNQYYFTGIAIRLKLPTVEISKQTALINEAMVAQKKALALAPNAAYIQNELGTLSLSKGDNVSAQKYFNAAIDLAPAWPVPVANLSAVHISNKDYDKGIKAAEAANDLQPGLQLAVSNLGIAYEKKNNLLYAEEYYRRAIEINSRHYLPFGRLGNVYSSTGDYAMADSFFHEAELRKKGFYFKENGTDFNYLFASPGVLPLDYCPVDTQVLKKDDVMAFFSWGLQEYHEKHYDEAERVFKKIVDVEGDNPIVFHYLGKIAYDQRQWEKAELLFKLSQEYYLPDSLFILYCDSIAAINFPYDHSCFEKIFRGSQVSEINTHYFLASIYEHWQHYEEAEDNFRSIISKIPSDKGAYIKLSGLYEKAGKYAEAEKVMQSYVPYDRDRAEFELNAFYRRMVGRYPEQGEWYYRLGILLYNRVDLPSVEKYVDSIYWFPRQNKEVFIDSSNYLELLGDLKWDISIPGSPKSVNLTQLVTPTDSIFLPGTFERCYLSQRIYTPRKDAIFYLQQADVLLSDTGTKAAINLMIGNTFVRAGSKKQAWPFYARSIDQNPSNANARLKMIDACAAVYENRKALEQLQYLEKHEQINFPNRLLLAKYLIHAGVYDSARFLLTKAIDMYPFLLTEAIELQGKSYALARQPAKAIPYYRELIDDTPDANTYYSLARAYVQSGNTNEAWKQLTLALNTGFNYSYVLNNDPAWKSFRAQAKWKGLMKNVNMRKYKE